MAKMWNPWRGCHKIGEGCKNCYIHQGDIRKGINTDNIELLEHLDLPIRRKKNGEYIIPTGELVFVCFSSDFLLEEADKWRAKCFEIMKERRDLDFLFLTKRISRLLEVIPTDWGIGYPNVTIGISLSTQEEIDQTLPLFKKLPIVHKNIILQPLLEDVDVSKYLDDVELVVVGGEYGIDTRPLDYKWVLSIREQCVNTKTAFEFRQCATNFLKEGKMYKLRYKEVTQQAKKANINWSPSK